GVRAALDAGVSITGAYDDACASFFGGVVLTDNRRMILFKRDVLDAEVMIYVPSASQLTSGVNVGRCRLIAPFVEEAYKLAVSGAYDRAMTLNGFLYCAALGYDTDVVMDALRCGASGCGLSGTGSAYTALFREDRDGMDVLEGLWRARGATVIRTRVTNLGVEV
ncbi:MAG: shikimate kinase, partial [Methermicoccaceae archaeon]